MRIFLLTIILAFPATTFAQKQGKDIELNLFLFGNLYSNAESLNKYVDEFNSAGTTTSDLAKVKNANFMAAEILLVTDNDFGYGIRYTATASASTGRQSGGDVEMATGLFDFSAVFKFMSSAEKFQYGAGFSIGAPQAFGTGIKASGNTTGYQSDKVPIARGFVLGRFNFGRFALHGEAGYLFAKATELKSSNGTKLTKADGSNVELDLSGGYISAGLGWQF